MVVEGDDLVLVQLLGGEGTQTCIPVVMQEEIFSLLWHDASPDATRRDIWHACVPGGEPGGAHLPGVPKPRGVDRRLQPVVSTCRAGEGQRGQVWHGAQVQVDIFDEPADKVLVVREEDFFNFKLLNYF